MISNGEALEAAEVPGHPGYFITRDGRVLGRAGKWMRPQRDKSGHLCVHTQVDGKRRVLALHRAVLITWVGPPPPGMQACHNNGDPSDNRVENLRWGTHGDNQRDRWRHARERR